MESHPNRPSCAGEGNDMVYVKDWLLLWKWDSKGMKETGLPPRVMKE